MQVRNPFPMLSHRPPEKDIHLYGKIKEQNKLYSDILNSIIWPWNSSLFRLKTLLTLSVHNLISSWRWISGSDIGSKSFISLGEKYCFAKAETVLLSLRCFSSTSIPIYTQKDKQKSLNFLSMTIFTYLFSKYI